MLFEAAARKDNQEDHKTEEEEELLGRLQLYQEVGRREPVQHFCEAVMHGCSKLREFWLSGYNLTAGCCKELSRVLITNQSLVNLDMSSSTLGDSGTKRLCEALRQPDCKLQSLTLKHCNITASSCGDLSSVLCTNHNLRELQLGGNKLGDAGLKFLCKGLKHPKCRIKSIGFAKCNLTAACFEDLSSVLCSKQSREELDLSDNELGDRGMKLLRGALEHPNCHLQKLRLSGCRLSEACGEDLTSVLSINKTLTDLELESNNLGDFWLRLLCEGLKHPNCRLQRLGLKHCSITVASCWHFSSVLSTNQNLRELQLGSNYLSDAGLTFLCKGLKHPNCSLRSIGFANCNLTAACCEDLSSVLCSKESLEELDLSGNGLGKRGMKLLCGALEHPNCHLRKLRLSQCGLKATCCESLSSVLSTNQNLTDLELDWNKLENSGLSLLCKGLKHPNCRLQKLDLSGCSLTGACCGDLASLLSSSQRLTDLNLYYLEMGESEARLLREGLEHPNCKLQNLSIRMITVTEEMHQELGAVKNTKPDLNIVLW
ncbi:ribonuclease inhibitor-like [Tiliqua scincoides]|uniref:ribonuclease inhibitor-like n=1 Tax=Tiliqua scincoides TaxID=71010 RepID=UPI003462CBE2